MSTNNVNAFVLHVHTRLHNDIVTDSVNCVDDVCVHIPHLLVVDIVTVTVLTVNLYTESTWSISAMCAEIIVLYQWRSKALRGPGSMVTLGPYPSLSPFPTPFLPFPTLPPSLRSRPL